MMIEQLEHAVADRHEVYRVIDERLAVMFNLQKSEGFSFASMVSYIHEIPLSETVVTRAGQLLHYETIELVYPRQHADGAADSVSQAITELLGLAGKLADLLPDKSWQTLGVQVNKQPAARALAWIAETMRGDSAFVNEPGIETEQRYERYIVLNRPFLALRRAMKTVEWIPENTSSKPKRKRNEEWLGPALIALKNNPGWSMREIADAVAVNVSTLSRSKTFKEAWQVIHDQGYSVPRGHFDRSTGDLEAYGPDDGDIE